MSAETVRGAIERRYLDIGEGTIGPEELLANGETTQAEIDEFRERLLTDEFYDEVEPDEIVDSCVDGRGTEEVGPSGAGGTFSYVMGDALTHQVMRRPGEKAPSHARRFFRALKNLGKKIGGHDDETHQHGPTCGCGAQDKLDPRDGQPSILKYIIRRANDIRSFLESYGVVVSNTQHHLISQQAQQLHDEEYAMNGADLREVTKEIGGEKSVRTLPGSHKEVFAVLILNPRKKLNRARIHAAYGGRLQAFAINVPALSYGSTLLSASESEADDRFKGALYYNVATTAVLASRGLEILVKN